MTSAHEDGRHPGAHRARTARGMGATAWKVERWRPRILGLGGTTRDGSTSEQALLVALAAAARRGAETDLLRAHELELPIYAPERGTIDARGQRLIELAAACDGLIVATPGFHGGPSGLIKNALDYIEELRSDERPYLDGRAVACIVCAAGWQAAITTLVAMRSTIHALRGWPTPLGVTIKSGPGATDPVAVATPQLELIAEQVVEFARWRRAGDKEWFDRSVKTKGPRTIAVAGPSAGARSEALAAEWFF